MNCSSDGGAAANTGVMDRAPRISIEAADVPLLNKSRREKFLIMTVLQSDPYGEAITVSR